jgi:hypothetical protein
MTFLVEGTLYIIFATIASYYSFETIRTSFIDCSVFDPDNKC